MEILPQNRTSELQMCFDLSCRDVSVSVTTNMPAAVWGDWLVNGAADVT